jgi:hypothetical protein
MSPNEILSPFLSMALDSFLLFVLLLFLFLSVFSQLPKSIREGAITVRKIRPFPILMMTLVL